MVLIDGHTGNERSAAFPAIEASPGILQKPTSRLYRLQVSGEDIEITVQCDLEINGNMILNVTVYPGITVTDIDGNGHACMRHGQGFGLRFAEVRPTPVGRLLLALLVAGELDEVES